MKLTFLVADLHLWAGGERVAVLMANHYVAKDIEVTLLSVGQQGRDFRFEIDSRVKVEYLNVRLGSRCKLFKKIESVFAIMRYFRERLDRPNNINTTEVNNKTVLLCIGHYPSILATFLPRYKQLRTVGCMHTPYNYIRNIWKFLRWLLYKRLDLLVSLTQHDVAKLTKFNPKVKVIANPLTFYPEQTAKLDAELILAVGRLEHAKGYDMMMEVFQTFCKKNSNWKLKILGEGFLKLDIENLAKQKGISDRVTIASATDQMINEYLAASIFLMTSRLEGLPMVLLEAQACGLPIVAFDCETGPTEIIHQGEDGYLVPLYNYNEMSNRLLELAADFDQRKKFGFQARVNVTRFLPENIFPQWDELFKELK